MHLILMITSLIIIITGLILTFSLEKVRFGIMLFIRNFML
jgi:hypothetical protein